MNNPNPFVPKGSLLEQQSHRRSRLKLGVFCVLAVSITGLVAMLIQGCKREQPPTDPGVDTNPPVMSDTNSPVADTNAIAVPPAMPTNSPAVVIPPPVVEPVAPPVAPVGDYAVAKGDTLGNIAKAHHVSLKDLQAANPGVDSKHLKIGQKLVIPASTSSAPASPTAAAATADAGGDTYTVKSGDTLTIIAKKHGTTIKALQAANSLSTTKIKVGQKLKLPVSASAAPAPAPAPVVSEPAPAPAPMLIPAPAPAPAK